ncbi:MAG TPA: hypothetical protein VN694_04295 [Caulobacteraceae bacterium]|nr:hypothetical protein [Caulobacteraceae bacterium]
MAALAYDLLDRRALAALRFVDATGAQVVTPVAVSADGAKFVRTRSGLAAVLAAPGLEAHESAFQAPPAAPAIGSVTVELDVRPACAELAARRFALKLPRNPDPAQAATADSLFKPVEVALLPTPRARVSGLLAALCVTVRRSDDQRRVGGALVRLRPDGGLPEARAITDMAGDALLIVAGAPLSTPGPGATTLPDVGAQLDAIVDPNLAQFASDADVAASPAAPWPGPLLDPDDIETRLAGSATAASAVRIACGQIRTASLAWTPS